MGDNGDPEEQTKRVRNTITKCFYHENTNCINLNCEYRHPNKVCKEYNRNNCYLGKDCDDNHRKKKCVFWTHGKCKNRRHAIRNMRC